MPGRGKPIKTQPLTLLSVLAVAFTLAACSREEAPAEPQAAATETEMDLTTRAGAPLFDGMGSHHHPITTSDPDAQRYFDQGLIIDFAFNHAESVRSFRAAQTLDPQCAMCYWGEALAFGPNINGVYAEVCGLILAFLGSGGRNAATIFSLRKSSSR